MRSQREINDKYHQINEIRRIENEIVCDLFRRGQLSGAQQALAWLLGSGIDPVRAILSDKELDALPDWLGGESSK